MVNIPETQQMLIVPVMCVAARALDLLRYRRSGHLYLHRK